MAKASLLACARQQLWIAQHAGSGRSSILVCPSDVGAVQHTVMALRRGQSLECAELNEAGPTTLQVLQGRVRMSGKTLRAYGWPGDLLVVSAGMALLIADADSVVLLTSAVPSGHEAIGLTEPRDEHALKQWPRRR